MRCYAYQVQVRDTLDSDWMDYDIMVSPIGHAPRTIMREIKEGQQDHVRIFRIKTASDFIFKQSRGIPTAIFSTPEDLDIQFKDKNLVITEDMK